MSRFTLGKSKSAKPAIEEEDEDVAPPTKRTRTETGKSVDTTTNKDIRRGKIHVETLYTVFDNYRNLMSQASYGASGNPFLLERRIHMLRVKLRQDLMDMGFGDILDFGFIPMPDPIRVPDKVVKDLDAKRGKGKGKKVADEDDDE